MAGVGWYIVAYHLHEEKLIKSYLYACVRSRCLNEYRSIQNRSHREDAYLTSHESDLDIVETEFISLVYEHMKMLPPVRLKIFKLIFFDGYELGEIASLLHISINTVKSQRAKALISLRKRFA